MPGTNMATPATVGGITIVHASPPTPTYKYVVNATSLTDIPKINLYTPCPFLHEFRNRTRNKKENGVLIPGGVLRALKTPFEE